MSRQQPAFVGIDIGTDKVKCLIGVNQVDTDDVQIIGLGEAVNSGMRRGNVVNADETVQAVTAAIEEAERTSGYSVDRATISINGTHLKSKHSKGVIAVSGGDKSIEPEDVARVDEAATVVQIPPNREIVHVIPRVYRLDGQHDIKDPVGMNGVRLEVEALLVTASTPAIKNTQQVVYQAGVNINDQFAGGLAASHSVLKRDQREAGVALVDIGHSTTTIAIHEEDELLYMAVLPIGSTHITHDLAIGLQTDLTTAETIKLEHAEALKTNSARTIITKDSHKNPLTITQKLVNEITQARVEEIFDFVNQVLEVVERRGNLPGGVVLTGGGANLSKISDAARSTLVLPVDVGIPGGFTGITDNIERPEIATVAGLMLLDKDGAGLPKIQRSSSLRGAGSILRTIFERLKP